MKRWFLSHEPYGTNQAPGSSLCITKPGIDELTVPTRGNVAGEIYNEGIKDVCQEKMTFKGTLKDGQEPLNQEIVLLEKPAKQRCGRVTCQSKYMKFGSFGTVTLWLKSSVDGNAS
jgi:hypothetical protein